MQRRQQLRVPHRQILIRLHPLIPLLPSRLRQPHHRLIALRLKLKSRPRPRSPNRRKLIRCQRRDHQFLLRHKAHNRPTPRTPSRKLRRPLPALPQIHHSIRRKPRHQPLTRRKRLPHLPNRRRHHHLNHQSLLRRGTIRGFVHTRLLRTPSQTRSRQRKPSSAKPSKPFASSASSSNS